MPKTVVAVIALLIVSAALPPAEAGPPEHMDVVEVNASLIDELLMWDFTTPRMGRRQLEDMVSRVALRHGLNPNFLKAMVAVESDFRPGAVSRVGAIGLMQLMPATARDLAVNPHDDLENLEGGARYIRQLLQEFGDVRMALWAYNAGPTRLRDGRAVPDESLAYARRVLACFEELERRAGQGGRR